MAKVFLDTNIFIDAVHRRSEKNILRGLVGHTIYASSLSFYIYCYVFKINIPNPKLLKQREKFSIVDLSKTILNQAFTGPTKDLEDNIQLHSAALIPCDFFLTTDKTILRLAYFGTTRLTHRLPKKFTH